MWCIKYDIGLYGMMLRSLDLLTRETQAEMEEREDRLKMKRVETLPNLKLFVNCIPVLNGQIKDGETIDLGRLQSAIAYWRGLIVECDPFAGVIHRWADDNDIHYAVYFTDPSSIPAMWKKNCLVYRPQDQKEVVCVGAARCQLDFANFHQNADYIKPRLAIIVSPSEVEWGGEPENYVHTRVDAAQWGSLFGNAWDIYQKACPPIISVRGKHGNI